MGWRMADILRFVDYIPVVLSHTSRHFCSPLWLYITCAYITYAERKLQRYSDDGKKNTHHGSIHTSETFMHASCLLTSSKDLHLMPITWIDFPLLPSSSYFSPIRIFRWHVYFCVMLSQFSFFLLNIIHGHCESLHVVIIDASADDDDVVAVSIVLDGKSRSYFIHIINAWTHANSMSFFIFLFHLHYTLPLLIPSTYVSYVLFIDLVLSIFISFLIWLLVVIMVIMVLTFLRK